MTMEHRIEAKGKFLFDGQSKCRVRGVTYGPFQPDPDTGCEYHSAQHVATDFALMAGNGINAIRTYTVPPLWLLDAAESAGLRVMVGIPWEQHINFLDEHGRRAKIEGGVRDAVRQCAQHPAVLCYAVGNEIPSAVVRWYGPKRITAFLERLCVIVKQEDPGALVTYVNYPTTEYLDVPSVDLVCFNVYLEAVDQFCAYLGRLQNLAGNKPLLMAEIGLDSRTHGPVRQAELLDHEVRVAFDGGSAGVFVFAWTDEWHRGGQEIEDWDFGLTTRARLPKAALDTLRGTFTDDRFSDTEVWPRISVVVCTCNGASRMPQCLGALRDLAYPDYEVLVVDDGSTDDTASCAQAFGCKVISIKHGGLSVARNAGLLNSSGEIVAYIDDDAYPDADWLYHLALAFGGDRYAAVGGPNIPPPNQSIVANCVANAPGGPSHVLVSDTEAEHIPGCNMAFRRDKLEALGGFDARFAAAGDDVDVCWRVQEAGWRIGFAPGAMVWHDRRNTVWAYLKQQYGYGKAEALLEAKWPERYNSAGHVTWAGRVYGPHHTTAFWKRSSIYHGTWGLAAFQSLYERQPGLLPSLLLMPEWYALVLLLSGMSLLGLLWHPLLLSVPLLVLALAAPLGHALCDATRACARTRQVHGRVFSHVALTTALYVLQPLARLLGRVLHGLVPHRKRRRYARRHASWFRPLPAWCEEWQSAATRLSALERSLRRRGVVVMRGDDYQTWDIEARGGGFAGGRLTMMIEEHGGGRQQVRLRLRPYFSKFTKAPLLVFGLLSGAALGAGAVPAFLPLGAAFLFVVVRATGDMHCAMGALSTAFRDTCCDDA